MVLLKTKNRLLTQLILKARTLHFQEQKVVSLQYLDLPCHYDLKTLEHELHHNHELRRFQMYLGHI